MAEPKVARVLCPVDFSEYSDYALQHALAYAKTFGAELHVVHVLELPFMPTYAMAGLPELSVPTEELEAQVRKHTEEVVQECRKSHDKVEGTVRIGSAFLEIIECAKEIDADLIVMGTHGRTGLTHMLIGSVAEKVVRKAPCPVLTVKHPDHEFEMP